MKSLTAELLETIALLKRELADVGRAVPAVVEVVVAKAEHRLEVAHKAAVTRREHAQANAAKPKPKAPAQTVSAPADATLARFKDIETPAETVKVRPGQRAVFMDGDGLTFFSVSLEAPKFTANPELLYCNMPEVTFRK